MKIAMIGQKGMPAKFGGVERHVHELSVRLADLGHDVTVYGRNWFTEREDGMVEGVSLKHTKGMKTKHLDAISHTLTATIHAVRGGYDVIHFHAVGPALLSWIPRLFAPRVKVVTTFHCIDRYHQKWNWFARLMLRIGEWSACTFAHETITVSQTLKQYCLNEYKSHPHYIPNGVTPREGSVRTDALSQFGLTPGGYLLMVSRLVPHKGAHLLVEAFTNLKRRHTGDSVISDLKLVIVGGSAFTDDYVEQLHVMASACNDAVFTGYQSGEVLNQLFGNCYAQVHPSMNEGLPITVLEGMSYKKPVLVSNIPEHLELISDERMTFAENDVAALESALYSFLNMSKEEREEVSEKNLDVVRREYDWNTIASNIHDLYQRNAEKKKVGQIRQVSI